LIPAIVLTGDISTRTLRDITLQNCLQLSKPVKPAALSRIIAELLSPASPIAPPSLAPNAGSGPIYVVDDDAEVCSALCEVLEGHGWTVRGFASAEAFLADYGGRGSGCLLIDVRLPGLGGLDLLRLLAERGDALPAIMITGHSEVGVAVEAMKAGARDFIVKPVASAELIASVTAALDQQRAATPSDATRSAAVALLATLTPRQHEVMERVLAGEPSKNIAADLGLSQRTVETHRAAIMKRTGAKSLPALVRLVLAAAPMKTAVGR
jgi:two-component system CheB/CheR fusion protein